MLFPPRTVLTKAAPLYGPHYGVAAQGVLRGLGILYVLSFWSAASQLIALSGQGGLQPASAFFAYLEQTYGALAPWIFPGLGWLSLSHGWMLAICGLGVVAGLGLLYGLLPWASGVLAWVCWVSLLQISQPWLSTPGDFLLAEAGLVALFLVPVRSLFYPRVDRMASRLVGIFLLNLLLVRVLFVAGMTKLSADSGLWAEGTALHHYFETQPLPSAGAWFLHHLPAFFLKYLLWGWVFIELMLPWYIFLPRLFRSITAGAVAMRSLVLLMSGHHGMYPLICILLALSLVDDVSWRRVLPPTWGPSASIQLFRLGFFGRLAFLLLVPLLLFQAMWIPAQLMPPPWSLVQSALGHVFVGQPVPPDPSVPTQRLEVSLQGSVNGEDWIEYPFWLKPTDPRNIPFVGLLHVPRLDLAFESYSRSPLLRQNQVPIWMLRLLQGLLVGDPRLESLFPANPFPDEPPRYLRLVVVEMRFADPVTKREQGIWWRRVPKRGLGPVFSLGRDTDRSSQD